jgi:hypothetical protein
MKVEHITLEIPTISTLELIQVESNRKDMRVNEQIKPISCVYFLYNKYKQLQYIGESCDIRMRLCWHLFNGCIPTFIKIFPLDNKYDRKAIESLLIKKHNPPQNIL